MDNDQDTAVSQEYSIKAVARRTGLSPHVIRVWERRYGVVSPERSASGRRLYSDAEIERLQFLQSATSAGHGIGQIAQLSTKQLAELIKADQAAALRPTAPRSATQSPARPMDAAPQVPAQELADEAPDHVYTDGCIRAMEKLDTLALDATLGRAAVALGQPAVMDRVVVPLVQEIGERWRQGSLRIAQEHLATTVIRAFLTSLIHRAQTDDYTPNILITSPAGQVHELGALMAAATAATEGWRVTYLGPSLPAEEIAAAALHSKARAVGLSIVYPADDPRLHGEMRKLREYLPDEVVVLVGGRAVNEYSAVLDDIGAVKLADLASLRAELESLRSQTSRSQVPRPQEEG